MRFAPMADFSDNTNEQVQRLTELTPRLNDFFATVSSPRSPQSPKIKNSLVDLLIEIGARGLLTIFGFRKTYGSQDIVWPTLNVLLAGFMKPNTVLSSED